LSEDTTLDRRRRGGAAEFVEGVVAAEEVGVADEE